MRDGIEILKKMNIKYFRYLKTNGEALLNNKEVDFMGSLIKEKKGLLGIFNKK